MRNYQMFILNDLLLKNKILREKEGSIIYTKFINRLKNRIYSWYVDSEFLLFKFMSKMFWGRYI